MDYNIISTFSAFKPTSKYSVTFLLCLFFIFASVRFITTWRYHRQVKHFLNRSDEPWLKARTPPQLPYTIPWLGNTIAFLDREPGRKWRHLMSWHPKATGVCSMLVAGKTMHIVYDAHAVQAMFKRRSMRHDDMDRLMNNRAFAMTRPQARQVTATKHWDHEVHMKYLLRPERVNELTASFVQFFDEQLATATSAISEKEPVLLCQWLRDKMFVASAQSLLGTELLKEYPDYCEGYFQLDRNIISLFFGLPSFLVSNAVAVRKKVFTNLMRWNARVQNDIVDPDGPAWEPRFGSRCNRARQLAYRERKLDLWTMAALDFGMTFGLNANAIPATGWMLMHILDPSDTSSLYRRIMAELRSVQRPDGSIDIAALVALPLLQSMWTEILRFYTDVLVFRDLDEDVTLPLDAEGKHNVLFKKGDNILAPTWIAREDPATWKCNGLGPPPNIFCADRFLADDPTSPGSKIFSLDVAPGNFFPFGGGRTMCPGRIFAKQEALGALAAVLLKFEFTVHGFVDAQGEAAGGFPGLAQMLPGTGMMSADGDMKVTIRLASA